MRRTLSSTILLQKLKIAFTCTWWTPDHVWPALTTDIILELSRLLLRQSHPHKCFLPFATPATNLTNQYMEVDLKAKRDVLGKDRSCRRGLVVTGLLHIPGAIKLPITIEYKTRSTQGLAPHNSPGRTNPPALAHASPQICGATNQLV